MRFYEWMSVFYYAAFGVLAWIRTTPAYRRTIVTFIAVAGIGGVFALRQTAVRNWLPIVLLPLAYWQTGQFRRSVDEAFQLKLLSFDRRYLSLRERQVPWIFEFAYLCCYPVIPLAFAYIHFSGLARFADGFWNVVLPPAFICYATFPFLQTLPPRVIEGDLPRQRSTIREFNGFVLRHMSIHANTFPSGHVAASMGVAFAVLRHAPVAGTVFLLVALFIGAGAILGRYHYALDVVFGTLLAVVSFSLTLVAEFMRDGG
jgi:hypothetical protein